MAKTAVKKVTVKKTAAKDWVFNRNGQAMTDSQTVAFVFKKEHKQVLRDIRNVLKTADEAFGKQNFIASTYTTEQNKQAPKYLLTEDGFSLLVMGYTGTAAMKFKVEYITCFRKMKEELHMQLPGAVKQYLALTENERAIQFFQQRLELDNSKKELKQARPKAKFHDEFVNAGGLQTVNQVAKVLGTGVIRFYAWLRAEGLVQENNVPYQVYLDKGYFKLKEHLKKDSYTAGVTTTLFTPKGVSWIANRYLKAGCPAN